jgi:predicted small integral membrane protein
MQTDGAPGGYIRGADGVVDTRRLFRVLLGSAIVALAALVVVLTIAAAHHNSRIRSLQHRGVPVDVTVTSCLGILSGTGITVTSFQCSGSYVLAGRSYNAVIDGSSTSHAAGDVVKAIADPKHPTSLSTPGSLLNEHSSWRAFIGPAVLFLILVLLIAGALWRSRRNSARRPPEGDAPHPTSTSSTSITGSLASTDSPPPAFAAPVAIFLALLLVIAGILWWSRRNSAQRPPRGDALG